MHVVSSSPGATALLQPKIDNIICWIYEEGDKKNPIVLSESTSFTSEEVDFDDAGLVNAFRLVRPAFLLCVITEKLQIRCQKLFKNLTLI